MNKFFGWLLIIIGVLVAGTAGLCSAGMLSSTTVGHGPTAAQWLPMVAIFGGIPFIFGVACIIAGWVLQKSKKPPKPS